MIKTIIQRLDDYNDNQIYIKREDLIPISFGGNKARKALYFFKEIDKGNYDCIVTYGSSSSNHCRVIANMAAARNMECYIIQPLEASNPTFNSKMIELFNAKIEKVHVTNVHDTIENRIELLKKEGKNPYFIPGGGHGNIGTEAYVECYQEIKEYEYENNINFDYIFFASGTGTTQAGLICGKIINNDNKEIIGISIARKNPYGKNIIIDSINDYLKETNYINNDSVNFIDDFIINGYGSKNAEIENVIKKNIIKYGIPMDSTYVGKAYFGMEQYLINNNIKNKNILFIHTGGTPLFFDEIK